MNRMVSTMMPCFQIVDKFSKIHPVQEVPITSFRITFVENIAYGSPTGSVWQVA